MEKKASLILFILLFVVSLGVAGFAANAYFPEKSKYDELMEKCTSVTDGEVVSSESYSAGSFRRHKNRDQPHKLRDNTYYNVTVKYVIKGVEYEAVTTRPTDPGVGTQMQVHYSPDVPSKSYLGDGPTDNFSGYKQMFYIGVIASVIFALLIPLRIMAGRSKY